MRRTGLWSICTYGASWESRELENATHSERPPSRVASCLVEARVAVGANRPGSSIIFVPNQAVAMRPWLGSLGDAAI